MSYCLNPACQQPENPNSLLFCNSCGSKLLLREHFRALRKIGQGGFGKTFLAVDEDLPSHPYCAIKQFSPQAQAQQTVEKAVELFHQEAIRLDDLGKYHSQIPKLLAYFEQNSCHYLVQEYIDGQNLEQELETQGAFNEAQIRQLLNNLLPVLQFVHSNQVIHRDIKPENIIRRTPPKSPIEGGILKRNIFSGGMGGQLVLVDFGAAKFATQTALATTQTKIGDFRYIAPEQAAGRASFSSDLYSLGVTCIHLLTGIPALNLFDDGEALWVWEKHLKYSLSDELRNILNKMLEYGTNKRYHSVNEVMQDLQKSQFPSQNAAPKPMTIVPSQNSGVTFSNNRDYTLIIDKSESMSNLIPERGMTRWEVAKEACFSLVRQCEELNSRGITLYLFWSLFKRYAPVYSHQIQGIFDQNCPSGSTDLAWVLQAAIKNYFQQKARGFTKSRQTSIIVITDGEPDDTVAVNKVIKNTCCWTQGTKELSFVFIQVGTDTKATQFLRELERGLGTQGDFCKMMTATDISQCVEGEKTSLAQVLLNTSFNP